MFIEDVAVLQDRLQQCLGAGVRVKAAPQSGRIHLALRAHFGGTLMVDGASQAASALHAAAIDVILFGLPKQL